jgi:hypothetical protein
MPQDYYDDARVTIILAAKLETPASLSSRALWFLLTAC